MPPRPRSTWARDHVWHIMAGTVVVVLCSLYAGASYVSHHPSLRITRVAVTGFTLVNEPDVVREVAQMLAGSRWGAISKNTLATAPLAHIREQLLETHSQIRSVAFTRDFSTQTLTVALDEYTPYAVWCASESDNCYYITSEGYIFSSVATVPAGMVRWYSPLPTDALRANIGGEYMPAMVSLVGGIHALALPLTTVTIEAENKEVRLQVGTWYIRASVDAPVENTLRYIQAALTSPEFLATLPQMEYLDARFGNRLFYKEMPTEKELIITEEPTEL